MRHVLLRRTAIAFVATSLALATGATGTAGATPAHRPSARTYVALGDSYAAGYGLPSPALPTRPAYPGCAQTSLDYPHQLAARLRLSLTDATCSGATTADFFAPQNTPGPHPPAQLDVVKAVQPDLVTVTIGGNDFGFTPIAEACLAATKSGPLLLHPTFANCKSYFASAAGAGENPVVRLATVGANVRAALAAVHRAAPHAKVLVIAYPAISPDARNTPAVGCFTANAIPPAVVGGIPLASAFPFTDVDTPYLSSIQAALDREIASAARATHSAYADILASSLRHSACSPESTRWVEPFLPGGGGTNVLHPSLAGAAAMAARLTPLAALLLCRFPFA